MGINGYVISTIEALLIDEIYPLHMCLDFASFRLHHLYVIQEPDSRCFGVRRLPTSSSTLGKLGVA